MTKGTVFTVNLSKITRFGRGLGIMGRTFSLLSLATFCLFIGLSLSGWVQAKVFTSPVSSMKGLAAAVSSDFFVDIVAMEVPNLSKLKPSGAFSSQSMMHYLFRFITNINPYDPKSLLAQELPGLGRDEAILLVKGHATALGDSPHDYMPSPDSFRAQNDDPSELSAPDFTQPGSEPASGLGDQIEEHAGMGSGGAEHNAADPDAASANAIPAMSKLTTNGKKVVFIYHTHNRESWLPELDGRKDPNDGNINVTLLGKRLSEQLEQLGIGAEFSNTDYASVIEDYNWNFSYKYSLKTVQDAFAREADISYLFDIHRDSQPRDKTTAKIDGIDYAQVYFIVGHKNPNWELNNAFAVKIQTELEKNYPGISRGIWGKSTASGNAEYNQTISPNSIVIEVGGIENTLEESYRTIDVLAQAITDLYWDAEKVNAAVGQ